MSTAPSFVTPLRYPGGKGRLGAWLAELLDHNNLIGGVYIEPYAGGAGAAMYLLVNNYVEKVVINDVDPVVYAFWWAVLNDTERLAEMILETPVTMDTWHKQREILLGSIPVGSTELGFATFFLNRTNRSGIIKGGVIGGQKQTGKYLIDARYNKQRLAARVLKIGALRDRVQVFNLDAIQLLSSSGFSFGERSLVYLDPPYYEKGSQLYRNHYLPEDHKRISEAVCSLRSPWIVTYDNCDEIKKLYEGVSGVEFSLHYSTHMQRPKATEVMFFSGLNLRSDPVLRR